MSSEEPNPERPEEQQMKTDEEESKNLASPSKLSDD